jgi:major membrane immunogen (membrane-anchored lipoprotein)
MRLIKEEVKMKKYFLLGLIIASGLFLTGCGKQESTGGGVSTSSSGKNQTTAKEAYKIALPEAKKFSSDSYLVGLNTTSVQENGQSRTWYALFYSAAKATNYKVNVVEGKITDTSDTNKKKQDQIPENWIDSDRVAQIAIPKCGETTEKDYFIDLDTNKDKAPIWSFNCKIGENKTLYVDLKALTGEYLETRKAGIGW